MGETVLPSDFVSPINMVTEETLLLLCLEFFFLTEDQHAIMGTVAKFMRRNEQTPYNDLDELTNKTSFPNDLNC